MITKESVMAVLTNVLDPELGVSIVDLGLVYDVQVADGDVAVKMTMTAPGCPMHSFMTQGAQKEIEKMEGVKSVKVELVWDPPWTPDKMSRALKEKFGVK